MERGATQKWRKEGKITVRMSKKVIRNHSIIYLKLHIILLSLCAYIDIHLFNESFPSELAMIPNNMRCQYEA